MPVQTVIQLRTSPAATWTSVNPTLAVGEVGFESDTNKLKIGNGTSTWTLLDYSSGGGVATVVSPTAPTEDLVEGMMWFNSTEAKTYIYYSSAWVELSPAIAGPAGVVAATAPVTYNSSTQTVGVDSTVVITTTAQTLTNKTLSSPSFTGSAQELVTVVGTGFAGYTYDAATQSVVYITANSTANGTVNIRGNSGTTLNTFMAVGESMTIVLAVTNNATAYYPTAYQIDGSAIVPKWINGIVPTSGNVSAIDSYTLTIIKTASATYTMLASQTKFA